MEEKILKLKEQLECELSQVKDASELENIRVAYLGKKGSITELLKGLVTLDESGYVVAGEDCRADVPGVFAAGDLRTKHLRQVVTAAADGATAIYEIEAYLNQQ